MASPRSTRHSNKALSAQRGPNSAAIGLGLILVAATLVAHFPAVFAGFIWDDSLFLFGSPLVTESNGIYKAWFTAEGSDYWPLMSSMFWFEWRIWGSDPLPYHAVNIALHAMGTLLLWRLLRQLKIGEPGAFLGSLLFAVHPVTVESVAWIAERKNVLSMPLFLLAILAYLRFEDCNSRRWYVLALMAAAAALLAKASTVMLPIVLLLCVWWRQGLLSRKDLLRTLPFFAMSLILGLVEMHFVHQQAVQGEIGRPEGIASRIAATGWIIWFYLYKIIAPVNLAMVYPRWQVDGGRVLSYLPLVMFIAVIIVLWINRGHWGRGPLAAVGYFAITLLPVLGLLNMQFNRYSLVADHLQYLAMPAITALIGVGIAMAWSWARQKGATGLSRTMAVATVAIVLAMCVLTWRQAMIYRGEIPLWSHTIAINPDAWVAYNNRGAAYSEKGRQNLAIADFNKAIELMPKYPEAYCNRGNAYQKIDSNIQSIVDCSRAIALKPDYANAYNTRGIAYTKAGQREIAIKDYDKAIELQPTLADTYNNRAVTYYYLKEYAKAWADVKMYADLGGKPHPAFLKSLANEAARASKLKVD